MLDPCHLHHFTETKLYNVFMTPKKDQELHVSTDTTNFAVSKTVWLDHMIIC